MTLKCGECGSPMVLRKSRHGKFYGCSRYPDCKGSHGAHPDGSPMGTPANKETKHARMEAHDYFDQWWKGRGMDRSEAYEWLEANGPKPHIAEMNREECSELVGMLEMFDEMEGR